MALERVVVSTGQDVYIPFPDSAERNKHEFEAWFQTRIDVMPLEVREMARFIPHEPLWMHYDFEQNQPLPGFHTHDHVMGAIEFALRYYANSDNDNDPLHVRQDKRKYEEMFNVKLSERDFLTALCVGLAYHDVCEIAQEDNLMGGVQFREDGYRGRRQLDGYQVPEFFSADLAYDHVSENYEGRNAIAVATLAHHIAIQTTFALPKYETAFDSFVRTADRYSGVFNHNPRKDFGMICEIFTGNPQATVVLRDEFNFHQLHGREVLHDLETEEDVLAIVLQDEDIATVLEVNELYPPERIEIQQAFVLLHGLYKQGMTPYALPPHKLSQFEVSSNNMRKISA